MENISNFEELLSHLSNRDTRKRVAVVWASDENTRQAVAKALEAGFIRALFVGAREEVEADPAIMAHGEWVEIVDAPDIDAAAATAVGMVREGRADVLMKGMLNTDNFLRAILNRDNGIVEKGNVITHLTVADIPSYPRLLLFTDAAVIPYPTDAQRDCQVGYMAAVCRKLDIAAPKIALVHCSEKVDERHFPFTAHYRQLAERSAAGDYGSLIIDGPLDVKTACSLKALQKKHIASPVNGEANGLIFPDIEAANSFYKTITLFAGAETAGMLCGAMAPVVLPSRGDSVESKLCSLAVASL